MSNFTYSDELFSDLHKDAFGFRPKAEDWKVWNSYDDFQKQAYWNTMVDVMTQRVDREKQEQEEAVRAFEIRIDALIASGEKDRDGAIRRILSEFDFFNGDPDYACFLLNLPYGYLGQQAINLEEV